MKNSFKASSNKKALLSKITIRLKMENKNLILRKSFMPVRKGEKNVNHAEPKR